MLQSQQPRWLAVAEIVLLTVAGVFGNIAKVTLFLNVDLIFGSACAMAILLRHGLRAGAISGVVIASYSYLLWNHPYAIVIFGAEILIVGLLERRSNAVGIVLFDVLYWLVIGMPLVYLFYHVVMRLDGPGTMVIMLKQATNGVFNATLGVGITVGLRSIELARGRGKRPRGPLLSARTALTTFMITLSLVPPIIMMTISSRAAVAGTREHMVEEMEQTLAGIQQLIGSWSTAGVGDPPKWSDRRVALVQTIMQLSAASGSSVTLSGPGPSITVAAGGPHLPSPRAGYERQSLSPRVDLLVPPATPNVTVMQRWAGTVGVATGEVPGMPGLSLTVGTDFGTYQAELHRRLLASLGILATLVFTGVVASSVFGWSVSRRAARLGELTRNLPQRIAAHEDIAWPATSLVEIAVLVENFKAMHASLTDQFARLVNAREAADAANRAKSQFLANISHEIRTPMHSVLGLVSLAGDPGTEPDRRAAYLPEIERSGRMLVRLLDDILDLSRIEAGVLALMPEPVDLRDAVADVLHVFSDTAGRHGLTPAAEIDHTVPRMIITDGVRVRQILLNLVGNAVKFTERGAVKVRLRFAPRQAGEPDGTLSIAVADTGAGIPPEEQERIFEPFAQQHDQDDRRYGGSGLGLAITARLVSALGGRLEVSSEVGVGSTFTVELPVTVADEPEQPGRDAAQTHDPEEQQQALAGLRVLVAEDDRISMVVVREYLRRAGAVPIEAANGEEAIRAAQEEDPHVLLLDVQMPVLDGIEAARRLRGSQATKRLPLVAMTAGALQHRREELDALFDAVIRKPYEREELLSTIRAACRT